MATFRDSSFPRAELGLSAAIVLPSGKNTTLVEACSVGGSSVVVDTVAPPCQNVTETISMTENMVSIAANEAPTVPPLLTTGQSSSFITFGSFAATDSGTTSTTGSSVVKIGFDLVKDRMETLKYSVIGRILLVKGESPWNRLKLKEKLSTIWSLQKEWRLVSLGRGYYSIVLGCVDDYNLVWSRGTVKLGQGLMRLQQWKIGFDPMKEKTTHVQVWTRFYGLPWGLWSPADLRKLASCVGSPLQLDRATIDGDFGHYARVLIDIDLVVAVRTVIHLEFGDQVFDVRVVPENLPAFCKACSTIGHLAVDCRSIVRRGNNGTVAGVMDKGKKTVTEVAKKVADRRQEEWMEIKRNRGGIRISEVRDSDVVRHNRFEVAPEVEKMMEDLQDRRSVEEEDRVLPESTQPSDRVLESTRVENAAVSEAIATMVIPNPDSSIISDPEHESIDDGNHLHANLATVVNDYVHATVHTELHVHGLHGMDVERVLVSEDLSTVIPDVIVDSNPNIVVDGDSRVAESM